MSVEWRTGAINQYVKPPIWNSCDFLGPYNGAAYCMNNLGEFPKKFSGAAELPTVVESITKTYLIVTQIPGVLDSIGKDMYHGDNSSYAKLLDEMTAKEKGFKECKAASVYYDKFGKQPSSTEKEEWAKKNLDNINADTLHPDLSSSIPDSTGGNPVVEFFAGFVSGGASYVDETANGLLSVGGTGLGFLVGLWKGEDPFVTAAQWGYKGGSLCKLSENWDSYMVSKGVNVDSLAYAGGKVTGNIVASTAATVVVPGGWARTGFQAATAFNSTYNATLRSDVDALGGVDHIKSDDAKAIMAHSARNGAISGGTTLATEFINGNKFTGQYTAGDLGVKTAKEAWEKGKYRLFLNTGLNMTAAFASDAFTQKSDNAYRDKQFGGNNEINYSKSVNHAAGAGIAAYIAGRGNHYNNEKSFTKYDNMSKDTKKIMKSFEKINDTKAKQAFVSEGKNSLTKALRSAGYTTYNAVVNENAIVTNSYKVSGDTAGKAVEYTLNKAAEKISKIK